MYLIGGVLLAGSVSAQHVQGTVFVDQNQNGKQDANERSLPGVVVSDGYSVVQSAENGSFQLDTDRAARFLSVTLPSGYKALAKPYFSLKEENKTGYAFALVKDELQNPDSLQFIQITDTETPLYGSWIDNIRQYATLKGIPFILHTGDICYDAGLRFHAAQVNQNLLGRPIYYTVGNHDLLEGEYGEKLFEDLFGPVYYSFEAGPAHVVVTPMPNGDHKPSYSVDQFVRWLKKDLALKDPKKPLIFINHNFIAKEGFIVEGEHEKIDLSAYNLKAFLYGHRHNNYIFKRDGVYVVGSGAPNKGGIDNSAGQFLVLSVDKEGVTAIKPIYTNLRSHIEILPASQEGQSLDVLAYDSGREIVAVKAEGYDKTGKRIASLALKTNGSWHWTGELPHLASGQEISEIVATVNYNNEEYAMRRQNWPAGGEDSNVNITWRRHLGEGVWKTSPLVAGKKVFVASMSDGASPACYVSAYQKESGALLWKVQTKNSVKQVLKYKDDILLVTDVEGFVYAFNAQDGAVKWSKKITDFGASNLVVGPTLSGDMYISGTGKNMQALDIHSGAVRWAAKEGRGGGSSVAPLSVSGDMLFAGENWNALFAYDKQTGDFRWKKDNDGLRFRSGGVTVEGDTLYTTGLNGIFKLAAQTGDELAKRITKDDFRVMASPLLLENLLIMPTATGGVKAYDKGTLLEKWHFQTGEALVYTAPYFSPDSRKPISTVESSVVCYGNNLLFGASDGYLYLLDRSGKLLQKVNFGAPILSTPTVDGKDIYVADFSGTLAKLRLDLASVGSLN